MATIRVLSAEGEETTWPRAAAAEQATALKDWIESAADDGGAFATPVPAQALHALAAFAEQCTTAAASDGDAVRSKWAADERSPAELAQLLHGAHFLEMPISPPLEAPTSSPQCLRRRATSRTRNGTWR